MSKVAIQGNASGTGTFTIAAPNSNTDRTLTLPDGAGTIATTNGITGYDQWYLTANIANPGAGEVTVTTNLQRTSGNITGAGYIGTAMSVSSGVFTFPSTGMWLVRLEAHGTSTGDTSGHINTAITTDNSTYTNILKVDLGVANSSDPVRSVSGGEVLVDISDTTTHKIKFVTDSMTATTLFGETAKIRTNFTFIRLGDT
jgi:hypothetical protein